MSANLDYLLEPFDQWLNHETTEDIAVQEDSTAWVYSRGKFTPHPLLAIDPLTGKRTVPVDAEWLEDLAIVAAAQRGQDVGNGIPLLKTDLLGRGRLQVVLPPSSSFPTISIRRGSDEWPVFQDLVANGLFKKTKRLRPVAHEGHAELLAYYQAEDWPQFLPLAVRSKKNIVLAGPNGSGKTHLSKALIGEIPLEERLVVMEKSAELRGLPHPNQVKLYYDPANPDTPSPTTLVEAALQLRIGRLFLQELLSGEDVLGYLIAGQTGHGGAITTIHARNCEAVFDRMRVLIKLAMGGSAISDTDINSELKAIVDVVVHFSERDADGFSVDECWYGPGRATA